MTKSVRVVLTDEEMQKLDELAGLDLRTPRSQALHYIRLGLKFEMWRLQKTTVWYVTYHFHKGMVDHFRIAKFATDNLEEIQAELEEKEDCSDIHILFIYPAK